MRDLVIRNARIVDGCGTPPYEADFAVQDSRIAEIGHDLPAGESRIIRRPRGLAGVWENSVQVHDAKEYLDHARPPGQVLTQFAA